MTVEELKIEAAKLGYYIIKKRQYVKLLPCTCGRKRLEMWYTPQGALFRCPSCGKHSEPANLEMKARENWNRLIRGEDYT